MHCRWFNFICVVYIVCFVFVDFISLDVFFLADSCCFDPKILEIQPIQRSVEGSHRGEDPHVPPSESAGRDPNVADLPGNSSSLSCLEPRSAIPSCLAYQDMEHREEHDAPRPVADVGESLERKRERHHHKHKKSRDNGRQTEVGSRARTERSGTVASSDPPEPPISVDLPVIVEPKTMEINKGASASLEKPSSGSIPVMKDSPRRAVEHATSLQLKNASSIGSGTPAADNEEGKRSSPKRWPTLTGGTHRKEQLKIQSTPGRATSCGLPKSKKVTAPRVTKIMGPKTKVGRPEGRETSVSKVAVCIPQADSLLGLITNTRKFDHITPVLRDQLHWLPIRQRIIFKIATFVRNSLHGRGLIYLSRSCIPISVIGVRAHLRSAARGHLATPRTRTRRFGPKSFRVSGPAVWNSLPEDIANPELSLEHFKTGLKTHLFRLAYA